ncbi:MAG: hypothetical protein AB1921_17275 [Thermodesulfobacteriota bacterium]
MFSTWNEYDLLIVFCTGVAVQSLCLLRSLKQAAGAIALAAGCFAVGWFLSEPDLSAPPSDRAFSWPFIWVFLYAFVFAIAYNRRFIARISAAVAIHLFLLAYYALHLSIRASGVAMPVSMIIAGLFPGVLISVLLLAGLGRFRMVRIAAYIGYLISFCIVIACQWSIEDLAEIFRRAGFSLELSIYVFLAGCVFLLFLGNMVQLFLLLPPLERASTRIIWDKILGPVTYHKEQADLMARKMGGAPVDAAGWFVLALQLGFLLANRRYGFVGSGIALNASVLFVYLVVMPWEELRQKRKDAAEAPPP